jgi:hypothetical protein
MPPDSGTGQFFILCLKFSGIIFAKIQLPRVDSLANAFHPERLGDCDQENVVGLSTAPAADSRDSLSNVNKILRDHS